MVQGSPQLDTAELKSWCRAARSLIQTRHLPEIQYWLSTIATPPSMTRVSSSRGDASGPARASLHVSGASQAHSDVVSLRADLMDLQQQFLEILEAVSASGGLAKELDACEEARLTATAAASPPSEVCGASQLQGGHRVVRIRQYILWEPEVPPSLVMGVMQGIHVMRQRGSLWWCLFLRLRCLISNCGMGMRR
jgi:hypothetical protein